MKLKYIGNTPLKVKIRNKYFELEPGQVFEVPDNIIDDRLREKLTTKLKHLFKPYEETLDYKHEVLSQKLHDAYNVILQLQSLIEEADKKINEINKLLDSINMRLANVEKKASELETKSTNLEARIATLEEKIVEKNDASLNNS